MTMRRSASSLIKIDIDGNKVDADNPWHVNKAGFVQHSLFHRVLPDAHAIIHTHTTATTAVCSLEGGLQQPDHLDVLVEERVDLGGGHGLGHGGRVLHVERVEAEIGDRGLVESRVGDVGHTAALALRHVHLPLARGGEGGALAGRHRCEGGRRGDNAETQQQGKYRLHGRSPF